MITAKTAASVISHLMKKIAILLSIYLLTGCSTAPAQRQYIPAYSETSRSLVYVNRAQEAREALAEHFGSDFPSNYQGIYFDMETFVIQISDEDVSPYDFLSEYGDLVRIETVEHTQQELDELREKTSDILTEHGIEIVSVGIDQKANAVRIVVLDKYTDDERAEISSYVEDHPVIIEYGNYPTLL